MALIIMKKPTTFTHVLNIPSMLLKFLLICLQPLYFLCACLMKGSGLWFCTYQESEWELITQNINHIEIVRESCLKKRWAGTISRWRARLIYFTYFFNFSLSNELPLEYEVLLLILSSRKLLSSDALLVGSEESKRSGVKSPHNV